jgi:hypothetical protein
MSPGPDVRPLKDMRFAAQLRRQFEDLAARRAPSRASPLTRVLAWLRSHRLIAAAAAAAVVVSGVFFIGVPELSRIGGPQVSRIGGPQPASARQVIEQMLRAFASGRTLQADTVDRTWAYRTFDGRDVYTSRHGRVLLRSDGSLRWTQTDRPQASRPEWQRDRYDAEVFAYDAEHAVYRDYLRGWDVDARPGAYVDRVVVTTGYPVGPPDVQVPFTYDFSGVPRAMQAGTKAMLATTTYEGRPAWIISIPDSAVIGRKSDAVAVAALGRSGDTVSVATVDRQTCLPMRFQWLVGGVVLLESRWTNVRVNVPLPDSAFRFAPPKGAEVVRRNDGFRRVPLSAIASTTGRDVLLPAWLPAGYARRWVAIAARSTSANGATEGRDVVAVHYTRGFDGLTVTTRTVADPEGAARYDPVEEEDLLWWADLLCKSVRLAKGSFAGATAQVVLGPVINTPHLWVVKDGVMLTLAGSASVRELVAVAESVQPYEPGSAAGGQ